MTNGWLKVLLGSVFVTFLGAVFWLGAAYQRFSGMENHLSSIDVQMTDLVRGQIDIKVLINQEREQERRIQAIENQIRQSK